MVFLVLFVTGLTGLCAQTATQPPGSGTEADPYQIATLDNLYWLSQADTAWGRFYKQTADIDASDSKNWDSDKGFSPIGNLLTNFTGNYNGSGHIISNLYINRPDDNNIGLFGHTKGAVVDSLGLAGIDITGNDYVGGLVGYNYYSSSVSNSYSTGSATGNENVGGLVGYNFSSTITGGYYNSETSGVNVGIGKDYSAQTVTGLTTTQMKNPDSFATWGLDTSTVWAMRADSTYPALRGADNAPFALPDTLSGSLSALLQNDFDYETLQENLVVKIDSAIVLPLGAEYITDLTSLDNGDSIKIFYKAGEKRTAHNDTLFSSPVISYLKIDNHGPELLSGPLETSEEVSLTGTLSSLVSDADNDALSIQLVEPTKNGQLSAAGDEFNYAPEADFYGIDSLKILVSDRLSITEGWVYINVQNINDAPVLLSVATGLSVDEDNSITLSMSDVTASDVDDNDLSVVVSGGENYTVNGTTIAPAENFNGTLTVPVAVSDGKETTETLEMTIAVNAVNDAPVISAVATGLSVEEDNSITLSLDNVTASDVDGDELALVLSDGENYTVTGTTIAPAENFNGTLTVPVAVSDGKETTETLEMTIAVNAVNDAPVITSTADTGAEVGNEYTYTVSASDVDNETLSYSLSNQPTGMEISKGGVITWTPENGFTTSGEVTLTVSDGEHSVTEKFTISVTGSTGINDVGLEAITLYPNPASETLYLRGFEGVAKVYLYNSRGQLVLEQEVNQGEAVQIGNLPKGTYLCRVMLKNNFTIRTIIKAE